MGWEYEGETLEGVPHGQGRLVDGNGNEFVGRFERGAKVAGETTFCNKDFHSGTYKDNVRHGKSHLYVFANGDRYTGEFTNGSQTGVGEFRWTNGATYNGQFLDGVPHGKGTKCMAVEGEKYRGSWVKGKAHGWGVKQFANGDVHEGYYANNLRHGFGKYLWPNGDYYVGFFHRGKASGRGRRVSKGVVEQGIFRNDLLVRGRKYWKKSQATFLGSCKGGKMHGRGLVKWEDDETTLWGTFNRGQIATGIKEFTSGHCYMGEWMGNEMYDECSETTAEIGPLQGQRAHGLGIKAFENGDYYTGDFVKNVREGTGRYFWSSHDCLYDGSWHNSLEHGFGKAYYSKGLRYAGYFAAGKRHGRGIVAQINDPSAAGSKDEYLAPIVRQEWHQGTLRDQHVVTLSNLYKNHGTLPSDINTIQQFVNHFLFGASSDEEDEDEGQEAGESCSSAKNSNARRRSSSSALDEREPWTTGVEGDTQHPALRSLQVENLIDIFRNTRV